MEKGRLCLGNILSIFEGVWELGAVELFGKFRRKNFNEVNLVILWD